MSLKKLTNLTLISLLLINFSCLNEPLTAERIIKKSIEAHGGATYDSLNAEFDFRKKSYTVSLSDGLYTYTKAYQDSTGIIHDTLSNLGFRRYLNNKFDSLNTKDSIIYANSLNSVLYFALLPYGLQQSAVIAKKGLEQSFEGKDYYLVYVSFTEEGGGQDFDDSFCYWINKESFLVDFLAYKYHTNGGGARFRTAINRREINGVIFQDYKNYEAPTSLPFDQYLIQYEEDELKLLSTIALEFND